MPCAPRSSRSVRRHHSPGASHCATMRAMWGKAAIAEVALATMVACGSSGASSNDVNLITPINPDCQQSADLCKSDADLIRNACDGDTTGIGLLLDSAKDDTTKALYESELSALCPEKAGH